MQFLCKGINVPKKQNYSCPPICADYSYWSTMNTKYGIFETICDELVSKTFGNLSTAIRSGNKFTSEIMMKDDRFSVNYFF